MIIELPTVELVSDHPLFGAVSLKNSKVSAGLNGSINPIRPPQLTPLPRITESRMRISESGGRGKSAIRASTRIFVSAALIAARGLYRVPPQLAMSGAKRAGNITASTNRLDLNRFPDGVEAFRILPQPTNIAAYASRRTCWWSVNNSGAPAGTRTPNPQVRSLVLYPVELRAQRFEL